MATKSTTEAPATDTRNLPTPMIAKVQPYGPGFNYWQLHVTITGLTPLLMNNPAAMWEAKPALAGSRGKNIPTPEAEAERSLYKNADDRLFVPALALRNCVLESTSRGDFRIGRRSLKIPLASGLIIPDERLLLTRRGAPITGFLDEETGYTICRMRAVVQGQGIIRSRARIAAGWQIETAVLIDDGLYQDATALLQIWQLFNYAGHTVGLLDYRPACLGIYGQFKAEFRELTELVALVV